MAQAIVPHEIAPGLNLATVTGLLHVKDNLHDIQRIEEPSTSSSSSSKDKKRKQLQLNPIKYEWGTLNVDLLIKKLQQDGHTDMKVEQTGANSVQLVLTGDDTTITVTEQATHINCGGKQSLRLKIRNILLQCIQSF